MPIDEENDATADYTNDHKKLLMHATELKGI